MICGHSRRAWIRLKLQHLHHGLSQGCTEPSKAAEPSSLTRLDVRPRKCMKASCCPRPIPKPRLGRVWISLPPPSASSGRSAQQVALAFLPVNVLVAMFSLGLSVALMIRMGMKLLVVTGLLIIGIGFLSFSQSSVGGN